MVDRYLAQDVRDQAVTLLGDSSSGFNATLTTIDTERSQTTPQANQVTYKWGQFQYPFLFVDVQESEAVYDETTPISLNYTVLPETYSLIVVGFIKASNDLIYNWTENYIEAIIRVLHNYNSENISWIAYIKTERAEIYKNENEVIKTFAVEFEARVN